MNDINFYRKDNLLESLLIVDGLSGSGKAIINDFISSFDKVEILKFSLELENLTFLKKLIIIHIVQ